MTVDFSSLLGVYGSSGTLDAKLNFSKDEGLYQIIIDEKPEVIAGFAGSEAMKNQPKSLIFGQENIGNGSLIYMIDNPLFRGFWENGKLFFVNALFLTNN